MTEEERDRWENSIGFVSLRRELNEVFSTLSKCKDATSEAKIIGENYDILRIEDSIIVPQISSFIYAGICNREGIFYVENVIHKVVGNNIYTSKDGQKETIEKAIALKKDIRGVKKFQYILDKNYKLKSGVCDNLKTAYAQNSNRKCDFELKTLKFTCEGCCGNIYYEVRVELIIRNYKKNIWGNWSGYQTKCYYDNVAYTVVAPVVTGFNGVSTTFYYKSITSIVGYGESNGDWQTFSRWWQVGDRVTNADIYPPRFDRVRGKASNRGLLDPVQPLWADIFCGNW